MRLHVVTPRVVVVLMVVLVVVVVPSMFVLLILLMVVVISESVVTVTRGRARYVRLYGRWGVVCASCSSTGDGRCAGTAGPAVVGVTRAHAAVGIRVGRGRRRGRVVAVAGRLVSRRRGGGVCAVVAPAIQGRAAHRLRRQPRCYDVRVILWRHIGMGDHKSAEYWMRKALRGL